jgi:signal transduction histidine kinase
MLTIPALQPLAPTPAALTAVLALQQRALMLDDRERIATDLHDHVIGRLFAAALNLQGVMQVLGTAPLAARLQTTVDDLDATIKHIRSTIFQLHEASPDGDRGVPGRLLGVLETMSPALGFDPSLRFCGLGQALPEPLEADLLAVLSEALTNVARHARASSADVDLTGTPDRLTIEITDDGIGIGRAPGRSGLATMRRRALAHDGAFSVEPWQPSGTRLTWTVPLQQHGELAVTERD